MRAAVLCKPRPQSRQPKVGGLTANNIGGLGEGAGGAAGGGSGGTTGGQRQDSYDDASQEAPDELWGKDKEQKEEHHEGQVWRWCGGGLVVAGSFLTSLPKLCEYTAEIR